jgi:hypothetical protein
MKKMTTVIIASLALLMLVAVVSPVMACNTRGGRKCLEKVPASQFTGDAKEPQSAPTKTWTIGDKFLIKIGMTGSVGTQLVLPEETLYGTSTYVRCTIENLETKVIIYISDVVWAYPGGTFEGKFIYQLTRLPSPATPGDWPMKVISCVLHGTGAFNGQTLVLSYEGIVRGSVLTGYLYR